MTNLEKAYEMARRVGLSQKVARYIYIKMLTTSAYHQDYMVNTARAIKWVSLYKHDLLPQWR